MTCHRCHRCRPGRVPRRRRGSGWPGAGRPHRSRAASRRPRRRWVRRAGGPTRAAGARTPRPWARARRPGRPARRRREGHSRQHVRGSPRGRSPPARSTRGWVLTNCPRWNTLTRALSARTATCWPISSPGRRVERLADLDVMVAVHLRGDIDRDVVTIGRRREQHRPLHRGEHLGWPVLGAAVHPQPGDLPAPEHCPGPRVGQVDEILTGEEVPAHVLHRPFHPRLVLRRPDPGRVGEEPAGLRVLRPGV